MSKFLCASPLPVFLTITDLHYQLLGLLLILLTLYLRLPLTCVSVLQMLEVIRLEGHSIGQEDAFMPRDIHLLQVL